MAGAWGRPPESTLLGGRVGENRQSLFQDLPHLAVSDARVIERLAFDGVAAPLVEPKRLHLRVQNDVAQPASCRGLLQCGQDGATNALLSAFGVHRHPPDAPD